MLAQYFQRVFENRKKGHSNRSKPRRARDRKCLVERLEDRRVLAITVNTLVDEMDNSITDGDISLRDAIALAPASETINFSVNGTIHLELGQIIIDKALTIDGPGAELLTIQAKSHNANVAGDGDRIFSIFANGASVAIDDLTLTGGDPVESGGAILAQLTTLMLSDMEIFGNASTSGGGVSFLAGANNLSIDNTRFENNLARLGSSGGGDGGGLYANVEGNAKLVISNSEFRNNTALVEGGGLIVLGGDFTGVGDQIKVQDSVISGNTAGGEPNGYPIGLGGGGLRVNLGGQSGGNFIIERSTVADNYTWGNGAGMWITSSIYSPNAFESVRVDSTTISGNVAYGVGVVTGITNVVSGGGGILLDLGDANAMTIVNSTISGNRAINGGGIFISTAEGGIPPSDVRMLHSTIAFNKAGPFDASEYSYVPADSQIERVSGGGGVFFETNPDSLTPTTYQMPLFDHAIIAGNEHVQDDPEHGDPAHNHEDWNYSPDLGASPLPERIGLIHDFQTALDDPIFNFSANYSIIGSAQNYPLWNIWGIEGIGNQIGIGASAVNAMLDPNLADNGGPTLTHTLLPGSPAIDRGDPTIMMGGTGAVPLYDQRGENWLRVYDLLPNETRIDIGAIEVQPAPEEPCPLGDYNDDGIVNAADYTVWRDHLGQTFQLLNEDPTASPGEVTSADYDVWKAHFGESCDELGVGQLATARQTSDGKKIVDAGSAVILNRADDRGADTRSREVDWAIADFNQTKVTRLGAGQSLESLFDRGATRQRQILQTTRALIANDRALTLLIGRENSSSDYKEQQNVDQLRNDWVRSDTADCDTKSDSIVEFMWKAISTPKGTEVIPDSI